MNNKIIRIISLGAAGVIGVGGFLMILLMLFAKPDTTGMTNNEKVTAQLEVMSGYLDSLNILYLLSLGLAIALILGAWVFRVISKPKSAMGSIISLLVVALICFISWQLADTYVNWGELSTEQVAELNKKFSEGQRKFSGANVWAMTLFLGLAIGSIVVMEAFRILRARK